MKNKLYGVGNPDTLTAETPAEAIRDYLNIDGDDMALATVKVEEYALMTVNNGHFQLAIDELTGAIDDEYSNDHAKPYQLSDYGKTLWRLFVSEVKRDYVVQQYEKTGLSQEVNVQDFLRGEG